MSSIENFVKLTEVIVNNSEDIFSPEYIDSSVYLNRDKIIALFPQGTKTFVKYDGGQVFVQENIDKILNLLQK